MNIRPTFKDSVRTAFDIACNCVPGLSTANNLANLWEQRAYKKDAPENNQTAWRQRVLKKKKWQMQALLIPVVGQLVVGIYKLTKACFPSKSNKTEFSSSGSGSVTPSSSDEFLSPEYQSRVQKLQKALSDGSATPENKYELALLYAKNPDTFQLAELLMLEVSDLSKAKFTLAEWNNPLNPNSPLKQKAVNEGFTYYKAAADDEILEAQFYTGFSYLTGKGVEQNEEEAVRYLTLAAERGHSNAQFYLGTHYLNKDNDEVAFSHLKSAMDNGLHEANYPLAYCYANGRGTDQDLVLAKIHLDRALVLEYEDDEVATLDANVGNAIQNEVEALRNKENLDPLETYQLARYYSIDNSQHAEAENLMKEAAASLPLAAYQLAEWYNPDSKMPSPIAVKDASEAFNWYKMAADEAMENNESIPDAEFKTGYAYLMGVGVAQDADEAIMYLSAAEGNHPQATYYLANGYAMLSADPKDENAVRAFDLYTKAHFNNDPKANLALARCFADGFGTKVSLDLATLHGELALQSANGKKERKEIQKFIDQVANLKSFQALKAKADNFDCESCIKLAECYQFGLGVEKSIDLAKVNLEIALDNAPNDAKRQEIQEMIDKLTENPESSEEV